MMKIILVQLGSPADPSVPEVRKYLREFLSDPKVVDINPWLWKIILNLFVLPTRPKKSAAMYREIWNGQSFPLVSLTQELTQALQEELPEVEVECCFILGRPNISDLLDRWQSQAVAERALQLLVVPLFPQYSESTSASVHQQLVDKLQTMTVIPSYQFISQFHLSRAFIDCYADNIHQVLQKGGLSASRGGGSFDHLIFSFHGLPTRRIVVKGDVYYQHCWETYQLLTQRLLQLNPDYPLQNMHFTFQSRFGSEPWITPYTDQYVLKLIDKGAKRLAICSPSFVTDCLETQFELGIELKQEVEAAGAELELIPALNTSAHWVKGFSQWLRPQIGAQNKIKEEVEVSPKEIPTRPAPPLKLESPPLPAESKKILKVIFLTLFLDLVGFSIIFPLFPALAEYYLRIDGQNPLLAGIFSAVQAVTQFGGVGGQYTPIVLFGGVLGALYSFLQFLAAPLWGGISDRIGRRPVLLISVSGLALSYLLWVFSGSFTLLVLARFIGGIMGGNISTATAVVADITSKKNRSKGMAIIGIAFATGFIVGPALGGILAIINPISLWPNLEQWGVNPFSFPALLAFVLSSFNVFYLWKSFPETLKKSDPTQAEENKASYRSANILKLFRPLPYPGVNLTNFGHFLFLLAFSGMEFTLTFLAFDRLGFTPLNNASMFIFIGLILALVQGGVVRRKASEVGEKKMVLYGLLMLIPGLLIIGRAQSVWSLYSGLFFLSFGSAMVIPCMTALISLYTPQEKQGQAIGIFRSLGALARVLGPLLAALVYWKWGSAYPYLIGSLLLTLPILMVLKLPGPSTLVEAES